MLALLLAACAAEQAPDGGQSGSGSSPAQANAPDTHSSRDALDWSGTYDGFLPCVDCPGTYASLTLDADGGFQWSTRPLTPSGVITNVDGRFDWQADGGSIVLDSGAGGRHFLVGEGRLLQLGENGLRPDAGARLGVLGQRAASSAPAGAGPTAVLADHRWTLLSASDAAGRPVAALLPAGTEPFVIGFAADRVRIEGGCNSLTGGYRLDAGDRLVFQALASTMKACDPVLMAADDALANLLAAPLDLVLARGGSPTLGLVGGAGEVLLFAGEPTPQARYGEPTTVFLEVAPQRLACAAPEHGDGLCLQVREIHFDKHGLRTGSPGEFRSFPGLIEGFEHRDGTRNVLRVHRFNAPDEPGGHRHLLDLVVESETGSG